MGGRKGRKEGERRRGRTKGKDEGEGRRSGAEGRGEGEGGGGGRKRRGEGGSWKGGGRRGKGTNKDNGGSRQRHLGLARVAGVVEAQTTHAAHGVRRQWAEQAFDGEFAVSDVVRAKDVACDLAGCACLADVGRAGGQDGVAVVDPAIARDESY